MEFKIWNIKDPVYRLIRYLAIVILPVLLVFYILTFKEFNEYLVKLNPGHAIPVQFWVLATKFFSYCLHIAINFCILLAITNRLHYSLWLVYVSFTFLVIGALLIFLSHAMGLTLSVSVVTLFVKMNKSFILLVLFIAGHFVRKVHPNT
jgi:hypothetical protein